MTSVLPPYVVERKGWRRRELWLAPLLAFFCLCYGFFFALTAPFLIVPMLLPIAVLGALAIWALPDQKRAPTRTTVILFYAYLLCLFGWPNYIAIALPGLPWITLQRLTGIPLTIVFGVCLSVSQDVRREMADSLSAIPLAWKFLAIFFIWQYITIPFSTEIGQSLQRTIIDQVNWVVIFFVAVWVFRVPGRGMLWLYMLWGLAIFVSGIGILEAHDRKVLWQGHIPPFLQIEDAQRYLGALVRRYTDIYRAKSIFTTPLGLSEFMALVMPFMAHLAATPRKLYVRVAAAACIPVFIFTILQTDSRLGLVGTLIGLTSYAGIWSVQRIRQERHSMVVPILFTGYIVAFMAAFGMTFASHRVHEMVWGGHADKSSNEGRMQQLHAALPKLFQNPIGHGTGMAAPLLGYNPISQLYTVDNYFISIALDYGVVGLVTYYGMIIAILLYCARHLLYDPITKDEDVALIAPITSSLGAFFVIKWVFSQTDSHSMVFMMMGLVGALLARVRATKAQAQAVAPKLAEAERRVRPRGRRPLAPVAATSRS
jgi:hypothetical protein